MIELIRRKRCSQEIVRTKASDPLFKQRLNSNDKYCFPDYEFPMLITRWSMLIRSFDSQQTIRCVIIFKQTYCSLELFFFYRALPRNVRILSYFFFLPLSFYKLQRFITRIIARYYIIQTIPIFRFPSLSSADKPYRDFPPTFHRPNVKTNRILVRRTRATSGSEGTPRVSNFSYEFFDDQQLCSQESSAPIFFLRKQTRIVT